MVSERHQTDQAVDAPGMIPADCEALLNKSQAWGYLPGQKWKPASAEQAMDAAKFFSTFRLVPLSLSDALRGFDNGGAAPAAELQPCDPFLAQTFLEGVIAYKWGKAERLEAGKHLHRFLLNQQNLHLPLLHRAVASDAFVEATKAGLVPGSHAKAKAFQDWMKKEVAALPQAAVGTAEDLKILRRHLALSGKIRDKLGALLPLP